MEKGIKETQEMVMGILELAEAMGPILKDGFQASTDLALIFAAMSTNDELKVKLAAAVEKANEVPAEVKDLSLSEGIQLLTVALPGILAVIEAWKKIEVPAPAGAPEA